jgi:hypothetical protein
MGQNKNKPIVTVDLKTGLWAFGRFRGKPVAETSKGYIKWALQNIEMAEQYRHYLLAYADLKPPAPKRGMLTTDEIAELKSLLSYNIRDYHKDFIRSLLESGYEPSPKQRVVIEGIKKTI